MPLAVMKRHLLEARQFSLCAAVAGICVLGVPANASAANEAKAKVSFSVQQGSTFVSNLVSGSTASRWADRTNWQSVFGFGQPSLFGGAYITTPVFYQPEISGALSGNIGSSKQVKSSAGSFLKLGRGTLQFNGGTTPAISQPSGVPVVSSPTTALEEPLITGGAIITSTSVIQPSAQEAAPSAPSRRPKPPLPPGPSVVSR